ncbi:ribosome-binding factor A [Porphyromonas circumdentaria]|uniref:Ribosome-binding factor A n=1 Tax=Porphyromonas circumdentaria TaxID=29524 RepID=A0A1T4NPA3_9PORP|nr:ribosome-binding factor A [Porphyromonas circumdentaria]MBB6276146.1 ribosome-binding factor A [Porphyromonas circumdentaria]MDO4721640.1 ribosome-binding factor A [Porphyromonas circumdentaria]SJZ80925.1 ribosome-binding factor A [Porphyromonas circumdentaria]
MDNRRISKVARLIQKELGELIRKQTAATSGVIISVTQVVLSPDLAVAKVYLSVFPSVKASTLIPVIQGNAAQLRYDLGVEVGQQLRVIPELIFYLDDTLDYLDNIDRLLKK